MTSTFLIPSQLRLASSFQSEVIHRVGLVIAELNSRAIPTELEQQTEPQVIDYRAAIQALSPPPSSAQAPPEDGEGEFMDEWEVTMYGW